jgi:hypothetical protein
MDIAVRSMDRDNAVPLPGACALSGSQKRSRASPSTASRRTSVSSKGLGLRDAVREAADEAVAVAERVATVIRASGEMTTAAADAEGDWEGDCEGDWAGGDAAPEGEAEGNTGDRVAEGVSDGGRGDAVREEDAVADRVGAGLGEAAQGPPITQVPNRSSVARVAVARLPPERK